MLETAYNFSNCFPIAVIVPFTINIQTLMFLVNAKSKMENLLKSWNLDILYSKFERKYSIQGENTKRKFFLYLISKKLF